MPTTDVFSTRTYREGFVQGPDCAASLVVTDATRSSRSDLFLLLLGGLVGPGLTLVVEALLTARGGARRAPRASP